MCACVCACVCAENNAPVRHEAALRLSEQWQTVYGAILYIHTYGAILYIHIYGAILNIHMYGAILSPSV